MRIFCPAIVASVSFAGSAAVYISVRGSAVRCLSDRTAARGGELLEDLGHTTGTDGAAALTDRELEAFLHRDRLDEVDPHLGVVARHDHLGALGQVDDAGHVRGPE